MVVSDSLLQLFPEIGPATFYLVHDNEIVYWDAVTIGVPQPTESELNQGWFDWQAGADDRLWVKIRTERDGKLRGSDWTHISDTPLAAGKKAEWATYRQSLRDIPQDFPSPGDVVWPAEPT